MFPVTDVGYRHMKVGSRDRCSLQQLLQQLTTGSSHARPSWSVKPRQLLYATRHCCSWWSRLARMSARHPQHTSRCSGFELHTAALKCACMPDSLVAGYCS
jgi:hypothetical protein